MSDLNIVKVHVPVSEHEVKAAIRWCIRMGKTPNRKNVAEMLRYWCREGLEDFATQAPERK